LVHHQLAQKAKGTIHIITTPLIYSSYMLPTLNKIEKILIDLEKQKIEKKILK
jgi:hypothetical protein